MRRSYEKRRRRSEQKIRAEKVQNEENEQMMRKPRRRNQFKRNHEFKIDFYEIWNLFKFAYIQVIYEENEERQIKLSRRSNKNDGNRRDK